MLLNWLESITIIISLMIKLSLIFLVGAPSVWLQDASEHTFTF